MSSKFFNSKQENKRDVKAPKGKFNKNAKRKGMNINMKKTGRGK